MQPSVNCSLNYPTINDRVQPLDERETPVTTGVYVRSGLLGFVGTGGLVFICGTMDGLIQIGARRHNTEDLIATVMAVEPHSFVYKGRYVNVHVRICVSYMYIGLLLDTCLGALIYHP